MLKLRNILSASSIALLILNGCESIPETITETCIPPNSEPEKLAIKQAPVPATPKWQEAPFIENEPAPEFTKSESKRGYIIFRRAISDTVYPNSHPKAHERIDKLQGFGCRNEFEPMTFSIYPERELKNLKVRVSDLKNGNDIIPSSDISVKLQTYWNIPYPHYTTSTGFKYRRSPELLEKVSKHSSPAKECQRYWLTVKTPGNAKPGLYKGSATIWDDGYSKAIKIPISFRVMSFDLAKDPTKHYTAYYYDYMWGYDESGKKKKNNEWTVKAAENSYRSMLEHGFDALPTVYLYYNNKADKIYARQGDRIMKTARKAGFKNIPFVPMCAGNAISSILKKYDKNFKRKSHWRMTEKDMPAEAVYPKITELFKKFNDEWNAKGYPKIYCCPLDEIDSSAWKFGKKIYKAVKDSGMGVYITKDPTAVDAHHYEDAIDAFCSQPFAIPYEDVAKSKRLQYWCYPNHNSWEVRKPTVMCNGGRMTYGFGFWKSGHTVLIPWAWSCWRNNKPITYFQKPRIKHGKPTYYTPGGNPADENGEIINTTYWECFREGYDDGRYIYTLQKAIAEREDNKNPECQKLIEQGKALLQKIWDNIKVEQKYKGPGTVSFLPDDFDNFRWQMASITEKLQKYKPKSGIAAPPVLVNTSKRKEKESILDREKKRGNLITKSLGDEEFGYWKSVAGEAKINISDAKSISGNKCMKLDINVDHDTDGGGEKGAYPIGWPRIRAHFKKNEIDLTKYEFLNFYVMIDSDRDEVADDSTPAYWTFSSHVKGSRLPSPRILGQVPQRVWLPVMIPLNSIIDRNASLEPWKSIEGMQFGISESNYANGTKLTFYIDDISLISFKTPVIEKIQAPSTILLPAKSLYCKISVLGASFIKKGDYKIQVQLIDKAEKIAAKTSSELKGCAAIEMKLKKLLPGKYVLKGAIVDKSGKEVSKWAKEVDALDGPDHKSNK
jgi:hypothetical protein